MPTRRGVLKGLGYTVLGAAGLAGYAFGLEPAWRLATTLHRLSPSGWPVGLRLRLVVLADLHAGDPYMSRDRVASIVARAKALQPDAILLLGDYAGDHRWVSRRMPAQECAQ